MVYLGLLCQPTAPVKNGSFIFCPTTDVVPWWQAVRFQIFIVVLEMPPLVSPENVWLRFQICQKNLDIANFKGGAGWGFWVKRTHGLHRKLPAKQPASMQTPGFLWGVLLLAVFKWSRYLKGDQCQGSLRGVSAIGMVMATQGRREEMI